MSNPDSFVNEVTEEVRRDRLFAMMRRYGWIAVLLVLLLVGGAALNEWRKSRAQAQAQAAGDALMAAMAAETALERATRVGAVGATGDLAALRDLMAAGQFSADDGDVDGKAAGDALLAIVDDAEVTPIYRELATLRLVMLPDYPILSDKKLDRLRPLTAPGAPFRLMAMELSALLHVERGETGAATDLLEQVAADVAASASQRSRVQELIVALNGLPDNS